MFCTCQISDNYRRVVLLQNYSHYFKSFMVLIMMHGQLRCIHQICSSYHNVALSSEYSGREFYYQFDGCLKKNIGTLNYWCTRSMLPMHGLLIYFFFYSCVSYWLLRVYVFQLQSLGNVFMYIFSNLGSHEFPFFNYISTIFGRTFIRHDLLN